MHLTNVAIQKKANDYDKEIGCKWDLRSLKVSGKTCLQLKSKQKKWKRKKNVCCLAIIIVSCSGMQLLLYGAHGVVHRSAVTFVLKIVFWGDAQSPLSQKHHTL